jgi:hypothetical protein
MTSQSCWGVRCTALQQYRLIRQLVRIPTAAREVTCEERAHVANTYNRTLAETAGTIVPFDIPANLLPFVGQHSSCNTAVRDYFNVSIGK